MHSTNYIKQLTELPKHKCKLTIKAEAFNIHFSERDRLKKNKWRCWKSLQLKASVTTKLFNLIPKPLFVKI